MTTWYARLGDPGAHLGTEAEPFDALAPALAVLADGDQLLLAGDGTDAPFVDQLLLDPWHTLAVRQWPGQPRAYVDFQAGLGDLDQASIYKRIGWGAGGLLELEGFVVRNSAAGGLGQDFACCAVFRECAAANSRFVWNCDIEMNTAARGLMVIQADAGTHELSGEVRDATGSPSGYGRCVYITGQGGGRILATRLNVMNCNTPDHAFYVSAQLGGYFCGDLLTIQQYGAGEGIASWLRAAGTMHFTRSRVELLNAGAGTAYGIWMMDSVVAPGEVIFERVEVDAGRNDPMVCNQHGAFFVDAPNIQLQNCTICGDFGGVWFMDNFLLPLPTGSAGAQVVNCIIACRNDSEVLGFMPLSVPAARVDGNIYYLRPFLPGQPAFRAAYGDRVYTNFQRWRRATRHDNNSFCRNPGLRNLEEGAFDPTRNSVAIDGGQLVTLLTTTDRFSRTAKHLNPASLCGIGMSAVDIGALEYEALAYTPGIEKSSRYGRPEYGLRRDGGTYVRGWNL